MKTAILIDGGFFRRRCSESGILDLNNPAEFVKFLESYYRRHLDRLDEKDRIEHQLYRVYYYDCPPLGKKVFHPLLGRTIDLSRTEQFEFMTAFLQELKKRRKIALRLGSLNESQARYSLTAECTKRLSSGRIEVQDLRENDYILDVKQKGVDMKIGLDIASLAYKRLVDQVVLIAGDSDFVPAAKLARREGIDFILDPLHSHIKDNLVEHVDGLITCDKRFFATR